MLSHACGAAFDNPELVVAAVVGDGEAETGPLATAWHVGKFLNPLRDGAVLPILSLNGYKIDNPTLLARIPHEELESLLRGLGWAPCFVEGSDPETMHQAMAATLDHCADEIAAARRGGARARRRLPRALADDRAARAQGLDRARRARRPPPRGLLARPPGADPRRAGASRRGSRCSSAGCAATAPRSCSTRAARRPPEVLRGAPARRAPHERQPARERRPAQTRAPDLPGLPRVRGPGGRARRGRARTTRAPSASSCATCCARNPTNFRLFGPDETTSNRLGAVYEASKKLWLAAGRPEDADGGELAPDGRVVEMLSEHTLEGMLEGYLLTGRHGLLSSYEAFVHVIDSMFNQHAKWLDTCNRISWREEIASLNLLITSTVWRQDHNGFTHQDPGFLDLVVNKSPAVTRIYLPPDANCLLAVADHCLRSENYVNVVVCDKQSHLQYLDVEAAATHCAKGIGIWRLGQQRRGRGAGPGDGLAPATSRPSRRSPPPRCCARSSPSCASAS